MDHDGQLMAVSVILFTEWTNFNLARYVSEKAAYVKLTVTKGSTLFTVYIPISFYVQKRM
jgi:hypothetical protein